VRGWWVFFGEVCVRKRKVSLNKNVSLTRGTTKSFVFYKGRDRRKYKLEMTWAGLQ